MYLLALFYAESVANYFKFDYVKSSLLMYNASHSGGCRLPCNSLIFKEKHFTRFSLRKTCNSLYLNIFYPDFEMLTSSREATFRFKQKLIEYRE